MIKYGYTAFDYHYNIIYSLDAAGLLIKAQASLYEKIKNNFEVITELLIHRMED